MPQRSRRDGRVAEGGGLLNRYTVKSRIGGSNPPLSASSSVRLPIEPSRAVQPFGNSRGPGRYERFARAQAVAMAAGRINMKLEQNFRFAQGSSIEEHIFHSHRVILCHC